MGFCVGGWSPLSWCAWCAWFAWCRWGRPLDGAQIVFSLCFSFVRLARFSLFARCSFLRFLSVPSLLKVKKNAQIWRAAGLGVWLYLKKNLRPYLGLFWGCFPCFGLGSFLVFSLASLWLRFVFPSLRSHFVFAKRP